MKKVEFEWSESKAQNYLQGLRDQKINLPSPSLLLKIINAANVDGQKDCVSEADFQAFALSQLPVNRAIDVGAHLSHCIICEKAFDNFQKE